jgi:hypothetical protein
VGNLNIFSENSPRTSLQTAIEHISRVVHVTKQVLALHCRRIPNSACKASEEIFGSLLGGVARERKNNKCSIKIKPFRYNFLNDANGSSLAEKRNKIYSFQFLP